MKKFLYGIAAVSALLITGTVVFLMMNYHTTGEGALKELEARTEGQVIPVDHVKVLVIKESGDIFSAYSMMHYPFGWFEDFSELHPTGWNVYDLEREGSILYTNDRRNIFSFGLLKNKQINYAIMRIGELDDKKLDMNNTLPLFPVENYLDNPAIEDVKLWVTGGTIDPTQKTDEVVFLDQHKEIVQVNKENFQRK
ncbi:MULTISPECIES: hypothetical protein [Bacillaceae]|uniref:Uncharacterized protein n=1 Tax=Domibacillus aminovorans TaxID=29332 RepID=A0A177L1J6_9BACI|nr:MULTISPECIES: hypothetical protein [Bacillaceae]OAH59145.1 hypothetical protein AWH48_16280 [Domibacillus aminovorans]